MIEDEKHHSLECGWPASCSILSNHIRQRDKFAFVWLPFNSSVDLGNVSSVKHIQTGLNCIMKALSPPKSKYALNFNKSARQPLIWAGIYFLNLSLEVSGFSSEILEYFGSWSKKKKT